MKTALTTLALTAVFFGVGLTVTQVVIPRMNAEPAASDSTAADSARAPVPAAQVAGLADEVADLQLRLAAAEARADSLRDVIQSHRASADDEAEADAATSAELASTLSKLEDEALGAVVQRLDGRSFVQLYQASSARNRARFVDALTPAQAAAFVRHHLPGGGARTVSLPAADSARAR